MGGHQMASGWEHVTHQISDFRRAPPLRWGQRRGGCEQQAVGRRLSNKAWPADQMALTTVSNSGKEETPIQVGRNRLNLFLGA